MSLHLGIDTGGTYTDAVLVNAEQQIVAFSKSLTTRHDLTLGISNALEALPPESLGDIQLVALSTTLSTNSVVEGRGAPVCILLPGYRQQQIDKSGLAEIIESELIIPLTGGHDAVGQEQDPLDEELAREVIVRYKDRVSAFGISSMFGVRNPEHEIRLRDLIGEMSSKPVTCGHELSSGLDAPRRALTVALNARMVPTIHELIMSMQEIMRRKDISAPLMMVKGDGSLVNLETALRQPVGTVLSGPAASVIGACALSGEKNAIIADMGGTTTDIAIVTDGQPELDYEGVRIGNCRPMVEAVRVFSLGLGGDSEVKFGGSRGIEIGPRRVIPLSLLGQQHPEIIDSLQQQLVAGPNARNNRFAMKLEQNEVLISRLSENEQHAWSLLADQPLELQMVVDRDRDTARALARLHRMGLVIFSGFTPTDAAHVLGISDHWSQQAAVLSAKIWARQMRHVYGLGRWADGDALAPSREVFQRVINSIGQALVDAGLHQHDLLDDRDNRRLAKLLAKLIIESPALRPSARRAKDIFHLGFASHHPVVAVGAPAACWYPEAANLLGAKLKLPQNADVANAYGAVLGSVVQRAHVTVAQPRNGTFMLYSKREPVKFHNLEQAITFAEELASRDAEALAVAAGSEQVEISLTRVDNHVEHDIDGELFLETRITATATGRPAMDAIREPAHASA
jgi:N-methylhydantoinase A/oxoprolinase/acetone carboxylase beta subunit